MKKSYRDNGAIGALLDEYEKAVFELIEVISGITAEELTVIVDSETKDKDCRSIQTILTHVLRAGYGYARTIRNFNGEEAKSIPRIVCKTTEAYVQELKKMFQYNEKLFADYPSMKLEEKDNNKKMVTSWGQSFDVDQLMEHAIVHILRHRRQIERFMIKLS